MSAIGFIVALACAIGVSWHARTVQIVKNEVHTFVLLAIKSAIASLCISLLISFSSLGIWELPREALFWLAVVGMVMIGYMILFAFTRAHQLGDQSQVGPLMGITPIFLLPIGIFILGDHFTAASWIGVGLVSVGCVVANWDQGGGKFSGTFKTIWDNRGARWMLFHSLCGVAAITLAKYTFNTGVQVLTFAFYVLLGQTILSTVLAWRYRYHRGTAKWWQLLHVGLSFGFTEASHYWGLGLLPAAYFTSIKRLSVVIDVLIGRGLGGEVTWFNGRFLGAILIFTGVVIFTL